jgi:AraC-like DNA-binding protein/mannose-6-phosphate isomerase-like protein (cupin superfamily)
MRWSLSEFLNLVELRSQTWCFVDLGEASGFTIPHNDAIYFYALLEGSLSLAGVGGRVIELRAGDVAMILSGEAHALRNESQAETAALEFLVSGGYADAPADLAVGEGPPATRLLAGRLKVRWPGGQYPRTIPSMLQARTSDGLVNFAALLDKAVGSGATAVLTRAATLMFVDGFRDHPQSRAAFQEFSLHDPISRAQQYIETHPFTMWTVEILARKVGMGRSTFAMRFTREVGRTPMEYLSDERMKHAALFLEKTDMKIAEIGERVGYRSEAAFIRRFTTRFGMSPGELRRRSRQTTGVAFEGGGVGGGPRSALHAPRGAHLAAP